MKLYQKSKTGKTKWSEITTNGNKLIVDWGLLGGKSQRTIKICQGKNKGKTNATTGASQALAEMASLIIKKKENGYSETMPVISDTILMPELDLDTIPESFCACKPINKTPQKIVKDTHTYAQRKHNGHCLYMVRGIQAAKAYSRRMEDKTELAAGIPELFTALSLIPEGTFILGEFVFVRNDGKEIVRKVAKVIRKENAVEAFERYRELLKEGHFIFKIFDILFYKNKFVGNLGYRDRYALLKELKFDIPEIIKDWQSIEALAKIKQWEGFVLRNELDSTITFTTNGKADRQGSYKYKFTKEGDFVVTGAEYGEAGKHAKMYSKFYIAQYDENEQLISCGSVGPGRQSHGELQELTKTIEAGTRQFPFVVEIEYADQDEDSHALTHGQITRIRDDKTVKECVLNE